MLHCCIFCAAVALKKKNRQRWVTVISQLSSSLTLHDVIVRRIGAAWTRLALRWTRWSCGQHMPSTSALQHDIKFSLFEWGGRFFAWLYGDLILELLLSCIATNWQWAELGTYFVCLRPVFFPGMVKRSPAKPNLQLGKLDYVGLQKSAFLDCRQ